MIPAAYLIGPIIGSLEWEYMYFAPYVIHLMKTHRKDKFIIFTRRSRFDLYGKRGDIFVPLKIPHDNKLTRDCFKLRGITEEDHKIYLDNFINYYQERFEIKDVIYPHIREYNYKVKWQFPKSKMDYDFLPRYKNSEIANHFMTGYECYVDTTSEFIKDVIKIKNYKVKYSGDYAAQVTNFVDDVRSSTLGCVIEGLKRVDFVIGNLSSDTSRLAILLKKPLITINEQLSDDAINLINPYKVPIIRCDNVEEGVDIYENNIRFS